MATSCDSPLGSKHRLLVLTLLSCLAGYGDWQAEAQTSHHHTQRHLHIPSANASLPLVEPSMCSVRHLSHGGSHHHSQAPAAGDLLGVVITVCKDRMDMLNQLKCRMKGVSITYHIYQRCLFTGSPDYPLDHLPGIKRCSVIRTARGRPDEGALLDHILQEWDRLPARMAILPGRILRDMQAEDTAKAVAAAAISSWAYKSLEKFQSSRLPPWNPLAVCHMIQRYTCLDACAHTSLQQMDYWSPAQMFFVVSAHRLRSVAKEEYEWLQGRSQNSAADLNGIWPFLVGCPKMAAAPGEMTCGDTDIFPLGKDSGSPANLRRSTKSLQPPALRVLPQECVWRDTTSRHKQPRHHTGTGPTVGVVLVFCIENLSRLQVLQCDPQAPQMVLHLYSKCRVGREVAEEQLGPLAQCLRTFKVVPVTIETELAWTKHHRDYLEHIITRYDALEPMTIFIKANFHRRRLELPEMISDVSENMWAFKSYGGPKRPVDLQSFPENGHEAIWQREICALYRRYACMDICAPEAVLARQRVTIPLYNTRSMWAASAQRIRSLRLSEYQWWREYISNVPREEGVTRRFMLERFWQMLLGCPEEHSTTDIIGCTHEQWHPAGLAEAPPAELQANQLVHWPQLPLSSFDPDAQYPSFHRASSSPSLAFVLVVSNEPSRPPSTVLATAAAAARFHPGCRFVLLSEEGTESELLEPEFWAGKMDLVTFESFTKRRNNQMLRRHLELKFLQNLASDAEASKRYGHLVMTDGSSIPVAPLYEAFGEDPSGKRRRKRRVLQGSSECPMFVYGDSDGSRVLDGTWYVPMGTAASAVKLIEASSKRVGEAAECCASQSLSGSWWTKDKTLQAHCFLSRCGGSQEADVCVRLLPCDIWQAAVSGDRVEMCPVRNETTKMVEFSSRETQSHLNAVIKIKDKSTGMATLKTSVLQLLKLHGKELSPRLVEHYLALLRSPAMEAVWMPPEKRGPPTIGGGKKTKDKDNIDIETSRAVTASPTPWPGPADSEAVEEGRLEEEAPANSDRFFSSLSRWLQG